MHFNLHPLIPYLHPKHGSKFVKNRLSYHCDLLTNSLVHIWCWHHKECSSFEHWVPKYLLGFSLPVSSSCIGKHSKQLSKGNRQRCRLRQLETSSICFDAYRNLQQTGAQNWREHMRKRGCQPCFHWHLFHQWTPLLRHLPIYWCTPVP